MWRAMSDGRGKDRSQVVHSIVFFLGDHDWKLWPVSIANDPQLEETSSSKISAECRWHRHPSSGGEDHKKIEVVADDQTEVATGIADGAFGKYNSAIPVDNVVVAQTAGENRPKLREVDEKWSAPPTAVLEMARMDLMHQWWKASSLRALILSSVQHSLPYISTK